MGDNSTAKPVFTFDTSRGSSSSSSTRSSTPNLDELKDWIQIVVIPRREKDAVPQNWKGQKEKESPSHQHLKCLIFWRTIQQKGVEEENVNILKAMQEEKKEFFSQFLSFPKIPKRSEYLLRKGIGQNILGVMYLSILIPRVCHPKEIKREMDRRPVVWHYLLQNSSIVMGYPLGKVAWLNSKHSWAIPTYVSNTTPPPWGLTLTGTSVEIVRELVNWLIENVHPLVIVYKSWPWLCFGCVSVFHVVQASIFQNIFFVLWYGTTKWWQTIHERISHLKFVFLFFYYW